MNVPNYVRVLLRHLEGADIQPGLHHVEIRHDEDCAHWDGGTCDCEPEVETGQKVDREYGGNDG